MKFIRRLISLIIALAVIAAAGIWLYQNRQLLNVTAEDAATTATLSQIVTVQQGDLSASLTVVGELTAVQQEDLAFDRMSGADNLLSLDVAAGNVVVTGQVLATIDSTSYAQALDRANNSLQEAIEALDDLSVAATALELAQARMDVAGAELSLKQALADLADLDEPADVTDLQYALANAQDSLKLTQLQAQLVDLDSLARSERDLTYAIDWNQRRYWELKALISAHQANLEQTEELTTVEETLSELQADLARVQGQRALEAQKTDASISSAQAAVNDAYEALTDAQAGNDALTAAEAEVAVQKAAVDAQASWDALAELETGVDPVKVTAAQADVVQAQQAVDDAQADLDATRLVAPFDGTILDTYVSKGSRISSSSTVLTIANLDELRVVASIDETAIRQVQAGQSVQISFDAYPGQTFTGKVLSVPMQGTLSSGVMIYEVPMSLEGASGLSLLVGMTANAAIATGSADNALLVPSMAVVNYGNSYQVLVPGSGEDAQPSAVTVGVGLTNGTYTQILDGLAVGDQVLVEMSNSTTSNFRFGGGQSGLSGLTGGIRVPRN
ncbi:MAG: efflux RND transporter periplasmic adaptor subunit [Caldilineaceae bacterium]|nr:efflux RND transporter periplasmic adaptor subunit [Caldilineaceae bacterium]